LATPRLSIEKRKTTQSIANHRQNPVNYANYRQGAVLVI